MPLFFIISAIVILCIPITVSSRSLAQAEGNYILQNITLRPFPAFALRLELNGGGIVITRNNKSRRMQFKKIKTEIGEDKKEIKKKKKEIPIEAADFKLVRIKELTVFGSFGGDDAFQTAVFCAGAVNAAHLIYKYLPRAEKFGVNILPDYQKAGLRLTVNLRFQFNLLMIFFIFFSILFRKIKRKGD